MKSYSFDGKEIDGNLYFLLWNEITANAGYFRKFCGNDADEAMQMTLEHSLTHYDSEKGSLKYYIMSLARTIKRVGGDLVFVDFLDKTLETKDADELRPEVNTGTMNDFSDDVVDDMYLSLDKSEEVAELALACMEMFLVLSESLITRDISTKYYSKTFITECLRISKKCKNFNKVCIEIYNMYGDAMKKFISGDIEKVGKWREVDYSLINSRKSKRITFVDAFGNEIIDADRQNYRLNGSLKDKHIVKIKYEDVYNKICDIIDYQDISPLKFTIGTKYICKTLGGSLSVVNPEITNIYELVKMEILTNLLHDTGGRYINIGSENIYILCDDLSSVNLPYREVAGISLEFDAQEVDV